MSDASILEIPIDDGAFQKFIEDFEKHKNALGKLPGVWGTIGKSINAASGSFDHLLIATVSMGAALDKMSANQEKFLNLTRTSSYSMESLSRHTMSVAKSLADGATSLLKWCTVISSIGGLVGAGGLAFGLDKLANYGAAGRRTAMGLGTSSNRVRAFGDVFGRVVGNPAGLIGAVADAQADPRQAIYLQMLGLQGADINGADPATLSGRVLSAIRDRARRASDSTWGLQAQTMGWTNFANMDEIRAMRNTPDKEWAEMQAKNQAAQQSLTVGAPAEKAWADLTTQLTLAKDKIGTVLVDGLSRVAPSLEKLSESVVDVFRAFAENPNLGHYIDTFAAAIEKLAVKLDAWLGPAAAGTGSGASAAPIDFVKGPDFTSASQVKGFSIASDVLGVDPRSREEYVHNFLAGKGLSEIAIAGIMGNLRQESSFNPFARRIDPKTGLPAGDQGIAQWTGPRKAMFRAIFKHDPADAQANDAMQEQTSFLWWEYTKTHKQALEQIRASKTVEDAAIADLRYGEAGNPGDWETNPKWSMERAVRAAHARREYARFGDVTDISSRTLRSPAPVKVEMHINNNTSAVTSTAAGSAASP